MLGSSLRWTARLFRHRQLHASPSSPVSSRSQSPDSRRRPVRHAFEGEIAPAHFREDVGAQRYTVCVPRSIHFGTQRDAMPVGIAPAVIPKPSSSSRADLLEAYFKEPVIKDPFSRRATIATTALIPPPRSPSFGGSSQRRPSTAPSRLYSAPAHAERHRIRAPATFSRRRLSRVSEESLCSTTSKRNRGTSRPLTAGNKPIEMRGRNEPLQSRHMAPLAVIVVGGRTDANWGFDTLAVAKRPRLNHATPKVLRMDSIAQEAELTMEEFDFDSGVWLSA